jgi:hypothetical protein
MNNNDIVSEALRLLEEEKSTIEQRIELIQSVDWSKPIDEDGWHAICETPLRDSDLLNILITNTFPDAKHIMRGPNYVIFDLRGYKIQIPTSRCRGINIATDWYYDMSYRKAHRRPVHSADMMDLKKYFDAKDQKLGWKAEANARIHGEYYPNDLFLFFGWFTKWKWKKVDRKLFDDVWDLEEKEYAEDAMIIEEFERENRKHIEYILNDIMPELDKFSAEHYAYFSCTDGRHHLTIKEILEKEGLNNGN